MMHADDEIKIYRWLKLHKIESDHDGYYNARELVQIYKAAYNDGFKDRDARK